MTAAELFAEAVAAEQSFLAHALFHGFTSGAIQQTDSVTSDLYDRINLEQAHQEHEKNTLAIKRIGLYCVKVEGGFALYFAEHPGQVKALHGKIYNAKAEKVGDLSNKLESSFFDPETGKHQTWREYRNTLTEFPAYVGEM